MRLHYFFTKKLRKLSKIFGVKVFSFSINVKHISVSIRNKIFWLWQLTNFHIRINIRVCNIRIVFVFNVRNACKQSTTYKIKKINFFVFCFWVFSIIYRINNFVKSSFFVCRISHFFILDKTSFLRIIFVH